MQNTLLSNGTVEFTPDRIGALIVASVFAIGAATCVFSYGFLSGTSRCEG